LHLHFKDNTGECQRGKWGRLGNQNGVFQNSTAFVYGDAEYPEKSRWIHHANLHDVSEFTQFLIDITYFSL
jgi:hypothetical protein